ncbi:nuclease [Neoasaia chiangmaiensis NBRC 101099]|uniref:Double-strand break repair protein AddB n=1 Tax=Neoasaia chiangmaiensis TaxID=320497 RepID=A0A1U9KNU1_9PROT|nr:double-strand break repair protein AddB [Neoasaia chiangmaiensis]AQS87475.1 double-strand break repair protein AddB [Neoasaia chiangmaiensis]GBR42569.1 nuclease [Neoasaia chiangmaiensis NBRC 101099]GEN16267.1 double-strand break repair protein AddB [Neoasaia chiangmaiensis]
MKIATIPGARPFLEGVAERWLAGPGVTGDEAGLILVPGRRAARALMEAFLRRLDGRAALLPRIVSIGDVDEDDLAIAGDATLSLPPAVDPVRRMAVLAMLVLKADGAFIAAPTIDQAWPLARALAELMDDAERSGVDLRERLPQAAEPRFAAHWHQTLTFLEIVTHAWPNWLDEQGMMNPVARQVALHRAQAQAWRAHPPSVPLWAVGFADGMASVCAVLQAAASAPQGQVVLPGVDLSLSDAVWDSLPDSHPQAGLRRLLHDLEVDRAALDVWETGSGKDVPAGRPALVSRAMLPAMGLSDWGRERAPLDLTGLTRLDATDQQQEAAAIAMILRDGIREAGREVALVTPDRGLARRVATELLRYGVVADDSAGEALALTPAAVFLRLLAEAVSSDLAPVALLAVLKHPLAALGLTPGDCRASARRLERLVLRGPAPPPGIEGLRAALRDDEAIDAASADRPDLPEAVDSFLDRLAAALRPCPGRRTAPLPDLLIGLVQAAEALATTDTQPGAERLWLGAEGHALSRQIAALIAHTDLLPPQSFDQLPAFLLSAMAGQMVFGQRVLQGRDGEALHPRVSILGVLEARLQFADLVVLGGLNEGIWPPATDPGPWLSRPMRTRTGLPSPERLIGVAAHDFSTAMLSAPQVVLSSPARRDGAPAVPARWLVRIDALLGGRGQRLPVHPALSWHARLDQPDGPARPVSAPEPRPPVARRPRRLSVTEIETWLRDPYAIYARHILKLRALPALEEAADRSDIGVIIHAGLDGWLKSDRRDEAALAASLHHALDARHLRPALEAWWRPRLSRIAQWVTEREATRARPVRIETEAKGALTMELPTGAFRLSARADRIELDAEGAATIIDYKTGTLPAQKDVETGWSSQLVLEAAMLREGAFAQLDPAETAQLLYWRLTGDRDRGEELSVPKDPAMLSDLVEQAIVRLRGRVAQFDRPETPYRSHPHPSQAPRYTDYALLARVPEWSVAREEGGE